MTKDKTKIDLKQALKRTRQQREGISIEEVAKIINKNFEKEEVKALIKFL